MVNVRALSREEQALFDEMKQRCLTGGRYADKNAKNKFKLLCHLEDFMIQYWELLKSVNKAKECINNFLCSEDYININGSAIADNYKKVLDILNNVSNNIATEYLLDLKYQQFQKEDKRLNGVIQTYEVLLKSNVEENTELKKQQKEFIKYMNDIIEDLETEDVDDEELKGYLIQRIDIFKEILQKYKSIIGV